MARVPTTKPAPSATAVAVKGDLVRPCRGLTQERLDGARDGSRKQTPAGKERIDTEDVLEAARALQGLERLDQIKYAVLERNGEITIIPKECADH